MLDVVMLDGGAVGDDFEWPDFGDFGSFTRYDLTRPDEVDERIKNAAIVLSNKVVLTSANISNAKKLKYVGCIATGYNHVDIQAAAERGVVVTNVPDYSSGAVAQHVMSLVLEFSNQPMLHNDAVHDGEWTRCKYFCFWKKPIMELEGKTLGIVGFGNIGRRLAHLGAAFGMRVLAYAPRPKKAPEIDNFAFVELDELFKESDFISLHTPLSPETERMVNAGRIALMKKSACIINTARGPLIDEEALAAALNAGRIGGAGLDVVSVEPMLMSNPLMKTPNTIITPHIAWASVEARSRLMRGVYANIRAFLDKKPVNVIRG